MNVQEYVISELIKLGNSQIGYTESPKGSNRTKYGNFVDTPKSKGGPYPWFNGKKNGACGWCSVGINWEYMMVLCPLLGDYDKVREFLSYPKPSENAAAGCPQMYSYLVAKWGKVAKDKGVPGDVIFFNNSLGKCAHVGRIIAIENGYYKTTEYNKGDKVAHGSYKISASSTTIFAIIHIDFSSIKPIKPIDDEKPVEAAKPEPTPAPAPAKPETPAPVQQTSWRYQVICPKGLNVRINAGKEFRKVGALNYGDKVTIVEKKNGFGKLGPNRWVTLDSKYMKSIK